MKIQHISCERNRLKKLPEALIISPELRHLYIHTYRQTDTEDTNRNIDRLYITRPKRLDTSKSRHAILHVENSVLPSAAINKSHSVQIAPTRGQNANQNPQGGDAIDDQIRYPTYARPPPPLGVNIDRCINCFITYFMAGPLTLQQNKFGWGKKIFQHSTGGVARNFV